MDDMALITAPRIAERCYAELNEALTRAGMTLNEDTCTAWTTDGRPPVTPKARALWGNARDHRGFVVCGFPATCEDPASEAALAFPIGDPSYVEAFLEARKGLPRNSPGGSYTWRQRRAHPPRRSNRFAASYAAAFPRKSGTSLGSSHQPKWGAWPPTWTSA